MFAKDYMYNIVKVQWHGDRIIVLKWILGIKILNIISTYAPQGRLNGHIKREVWQTLEEVIHGRCMMERKKLYIWRVFK